MGRLSFFNNQEEAVRQTGESVFEMDASRPVRVVIVSKVFKGPRQEGAWNTARHAVCGLHVSAEAQTWTDTLKLSL
jgi:hypothetical protein